MTVPAAMKELENYAICGPTLLKRMVGNSDNRVSVVLTSSGYDGALAAQPDSAVSAINFMFNIFPAICAAIMFIG